MQLLIYIYRKQKGYFLPVVLVAIFGVIFIKWGIDVSGNIIKNTILVSIGTSLIAGDIVTILDITNKTVQSRMFEHIDDITNQAGIDNCYEKRDLDEYDELIKNAQRSIDVTGYSLRGFYQSYKDILLKKISENRQFKLRILIVDPESIYSAAREKNEDGVENGTYKNALAALLEGFQIAGNIEIKTLSHPFGHMIYRIDDTMFIGPYLYKRSSKSTYTVKLNKDGYLFATYQQEFDQMWQDAAVL